MTRFRALLVEKSATGQFERRIVERSVNELPAGDLLVDVRYSSVNYKDGLSATGNPGVTRKFPHTPGIDAAGFVVESAVPQFKQGDSIVAIGFDLGMNTPGGFGQRIRIPAGWAVPLPKGLTLEESMILGTAGFTAALAVHKLEKAGMTPACGPVLVTGATGGVGSVAVELLAQLGYEVAAVTGKPDQAQFLREIGAREILTREEALDGAARPLLKERWGGAIDTVGGEMLFNAVKSLKYGCSLAACGLVASAAIPATVLPFLLRHVNLLGIDSVELPLPQKAEIWQKLAGPWKLAKLTKLERKFGFAELSGTIDTVLAGLMVGRGVLDLSA
jgi:putative YhdH/YhfP family quinone oxidoreductase